MEIVDVSIRDDEAGCEELLDGTELLGGIEEL